MKTSVVNRSWKAFADGLNRVIALDKNKSIESQRTEKKPGFEKYSSWPSQDFGRLSFTASDLKLRPIDFRVLEQFVETMLPKNLSNKDFITSQLQIESFEQQSLSNMQKIRSLKRLKDLLCLTIKDIKAIEINHIARNRG